MARINHLLMLLAAVLLMSCYNHRQRTPDAWDLTKQQIDSISFSTTHHYSQNYNFVVTTGSLPLSDALPDMVFDTIYVTRGERVVVAEIATVPADSVDSIWVKVARDQITQGWIRESELLKGVSPDDPISEFIDVFSDNHLLIFLALCAVVGGAYAMRRLLRRNAYIVHFNDIDSFYPTLLCLLVASSATLYATIQMFGPESWRHYYFHPSLNPFGLPLHLALHHQEQATTQKDKEMSFIKAELSSDLDSHREICTPQKQNALQKLILSLLAYVLQLVILMWQKKDVV